MKKKLVAVAFLSTLLTACSSPKYKISEKAVGNYLGVVNDMEQCIYPSLTNKYAENLLSNDEKSLLSEYRKDILASVIGAENYKLMREDTQSREYARKKIRELDHYNKANILTSEQCEAYKTKFANDLAAIKQKNAEQAKRNQQKREQEALARQNAEAYRAQYMQARMDAIMRRASGNMTPSETAQEIARQQRALQQEQAQQQLNMQRQQMNMQQQQNQALLEMQERQNQERMRMMQNNQNRTYDVDCERYVGSTSRCTVR